MNKNEFDIYAAACPSRKVLEIISNKWVILIMQKIAIRPYRFGELNREIGGVSKKVLTETLRLLERNGLILREEYDVLPLKVEYSLTDLGKNLNIIFVKITEWSETNIEKIQQAQLEYER